MNDLIEEIRKIVNNEKISGIEAKLMIKDLLEMLKLEKGER